MKHKKSNLLLPLLAAIILLFTSQFAFAATTKLTGVRISAPGDTSRFVLTFSQKPKFQTLNLKNPNRLVIDLENTQLVTGFAKVALKDQPIVKIRSAKKDKNLRIVLELKNTLEQKIFTLPASGSYGA